MSKNMKGAGKAMRLMSSDEYFGNTDNMEYYPCLSLTNSEINELDDWEVGKEYLLAVRVKLTRKNESKVGTEGSFDVLGVKVKDDLYTEAQKKLVKLME